MCLKVSYISGGPQICSIAKGGLELLILMAQSPKCWTGRHVPLCPVYVVLGVGIDLFILGKHSSR